MQKHFVVGVYMLIILCCGTGVAQRIEVGQSQKSGRLAYAIVSNYIDPEFKERRLIRVLVKKESFTRENLLQIQNLIEVRYRKPAHFYLEFFTDLDDVETPEEADGPGQTYHQKGVEGKKYKGDYAVFVKLGRGEYGNRFLYFANGDFLEIEN